MKIYESIENSAAVVRLEGKMMGGPETQKLYERIKFFQSVGIRNMVINLDTLDWLNSAGLGILIASLMAVRKSGGELVLAHVKGKAAEVICMTHLNKLFRSYASIDEAFLALEHLSNQANQ